MKLCGKKKKKKPELLRISKLTYHGPSELPTPYFKITTTLPQLNFSKALIVRSPVLLKPLSIIPHLFVQERCQKHFLKFYFI